MAERRVCQACGAELPGNTPEGLCPKCLMLVAMGESRAGVTPDNSAKIDGPGTVIGRYELLELIGEGGMGLVYLAEQKEPVRRKVALKIIKPGMDSRQVIARFEAERQALALLDHPNIAHVFDAGGTETGRPYFVMEHVKGLPITRYCDDNKLTIEQRLRLFEQVCEAVHHAHQKGIIHRDLKPSNILVSVHNDQALPKIIDFGIAKATTQPLTDKALVTFQGQLLGTPEYMSPEQVDFASQDIDTRSDIYSLGVVLYELLAGVLPFESELFERAGLSEIQQTIREQEPASPSLRLTCLGEKAKGIAASRGTQVVPLARRLHRELEWIPLKAMRKDRCRRYKSAAEMAGDIRNYLNGNPLLAGPETTIYRVQKFVRKHAGSVATVALVAVTIVLGLAISTVMYIRAEDARQRETLARTRAEQAEGTAEERAEQLRRTLYANSIQLADAKYRQGNAARVRSLLHSCPQDLRDWEWNRLNYIQDQSIRTLHVEDESLSAAVFSPDARHIVTAGDDKTIKVWDWASGKELKTLRGHEDSIEALAVSPDGTRVASSEWGEKAVRVWDVQTGIQVMTLQGHRDWVRSVAFSPDGARIASGGDDMTVKIWDSRTGIEVATLQGHQDTISAVGFSPDGKRVVSGGDDETVKVWDAASGVELTTIPGTHVHYLNYKAYCLAFSPDGSRILTGSKGKTVRVWDATTGDCVLTIRGHDGPVGSVAFSPDGKLIASGGADNAIKIWDAATGEELSTLRGHNWVVNAVTFSLDARHLVSASWDGTVKLWDVAVERESVKLRGHSGLVSSLAFSPDGRRIVSSSWDSTIKVWDIQTGTEIRTICSRVGEPWRAVFSPDGTRIASGALDAKTVWVWDALTGVKLRTFRGHTRGIQQVAFSADGRHVASSGGDGTIRLWDAASGSEVMTFRGHRGTVRSVTFDPDGKCLASGGDDMTIKVWDTQTGAEVRTLRGHQESVSEVAFSPDGRLIASASCDRSAKIWDLTTGGDLMTLRGHVDIVTSIAFGSDGRRIITGGRDGKVVLWDRATGDELLVLDAHFGVSSVALSPDGKTIGAATYGGNVVLWESTPPVAGYEARTTGESARKLAATLYEEYGSYHDAMNQLKMDQSLNDPTRIVVLQIVSSRRWEDGERLRNEAWKAASLPGKGIEEYQAALEKGEKANRWEPNDPAILTALGAAQYRLGSYEDALKTLVRSARILSDTKEDIDPVNAAFMATTLYQIGRTDDAAAALKRLRELFGDEEFADNEEVQALLVEAEELIGGKKP